MTCYFRGLTDVFQKAGVEVTRQNRKEVDKVIQEIVGLQNEHCPVVWKEVKKRLAEDEAGFTSKLKIAWHNRQVKY